MKIAVLYASVHHHNTARVIARLKKTITADFYNVTAGESPNIGVYDLVVLASGIYFGTLHKALVRRIEAGELAGKPVAVVYTYGAHYINYGRRAGRLLEAHGARYLGAARCRGYDTYGLLRRIGGIAKGHPNAADLERVSRQLRELIDGYAHQEDNER